MLKRKSRYVGPHITVTATTFLNVAFSKACIDTFNRSLLPLIYSKCLAELLMGVTDDAVTGELDPKVFSLIASYCDLGSFQHYVPREELDRRVNEYVREQHRLRETFVHAVENG